MNNAAVRTGMSRRALLVAAATAATWAGARQAFGAPTTTVETTSTPPATGKLKVSMFSKHLQFLSVPEAAAAAKTMGFNALDLTVRADGHVLPENVATDLPQAVDAIHKAGLEIEMITTDIMPDNLTGAEAILKAASSLGIRNYRWGGLKYNTQQAIPVQLEALKPKVQALAELNRRTGTCGMYHTHSGPGMIGATIWDVWSLMRDLDPQYMGLNYDIGHATVEGGYGGWIATSRLAGRHMRGIAVKDFLWQRNEAGNTHADPYDKSLGVVGAFVPHWCPIDKGMVRFDSFFAIAKEQGFAGPLQMHIEYPLGGSENGKRTLTLPKDKVLDSMHTDLLAVRAHLAKAGLA